MAVAGGTRAVPVAKRGQSRLGIGGACASAVDPSTVASKNVDVSEATPQDAAERMKKSSVAYWMPFLLQSSSIALNFFYGKSPISARRIR